jgi:hypothetical protein
MKRNIFANGAGQEFGDLPVGHFTTVVHPLNHATGVENLYQFQQRHLLTPPASNANAHVGMMLALHDAIPIPEYDASKVRHWESFLEQQNGAGAV